jgi:hypothetical protein
MVISISNESKEVCKDMLKDEINRNTHEGAGREVEEYHDNTNKKNL